MSTLEMKFWRLVEKRARDDCWEWLGYRDRLGYGIFSINGREKEKAHRYSYLLHHGELPEGLVVRHTCDNRGCANPSHLLIGTQKDNVADCWARGRGAKHLGNDNFMSAIPESAITDIRRRVSAGERQSDIANELNVTRQAIWAVVHRKTWAHVEE